MHEASCFNPPHPEMEGKELFCVVFVLRSKISMCVYVCVCVRFLLYIICIEDQNTYFTSSLRTVLCGSHKLRGLFDGLDLDIRLRLELGSGQIWILLWWSRLYSMKVLKKIEVQRCVYLSVVSSWIGNIYKKLKGKWWWKKRRIKWNVFGAGVGEEESKCTDGGEGELNGCFRSSNRRRLFCSGDCQ